MVQFEIVGTLKEIKDKETFHPFEVKDFEKSGWQTTRYKFNIVSGTNRFMCEISGGKWKEDSKNRILTFTKSTDGKKGEKIEIPWEKRNDPDIIDKVAGYRVFTCNLLTLEEAKTADEETKKKKAHHFLEQTEFATFVKKVIDSGKYDNDKFKIQGTMDFQYSEKNDQFYRTMQVTKIYKVDPSTEDKAEMTIDAFYTEESIDDSLFNCYTDYYFSNVKKKCFVPTSLVFHSDGTEKGDKVVAAFKKKLSIFDDEAKVRKVNLVCTMVDGAEAVSITYNDLDEETKELIDLGLLEESEAIKALGGNMFGERKTENRIKAFGRGSVKGTESTIYSEEDLHIKPVVVSEESKEEDSTDLFADEDDDI